jgi:hypothetical protein
VRLNVIKNFVVKLEEILSALKTCGGLRLRSSSLLLVYDGYLADLDLTKHYTCNNPKHKKFMEKKLKQNIAIGHQSY